jgi:hypothetical protein
MFGSTGTRKKTIFKKEPKVLKSRAIIGREAQEYL